MRYLIWLLLVGCADGGSTDLSAPQAPDSPSTTPVPIVASPCTEPTIQPQPINAIPVGTVVSLCSPTEGQYWAVVTKPAHSQARVASVGGGVFEVILTVDLPGTYVVAVGRSATSIFHEFTMTAIEPVTVLAVRVTGHLGSSDSRVEGTVTYELGQGPYATDVRGLHPNGVYHLASWSIVVTPGEAMRRIGVPPTTYASDQPNHTVEFCQGTCVFNTGPTVTLIFSNEGAYRLSLYWHTLDPTPLINPPSTVMEWGTPLETTYRIPCPICGPLVIGATSVEAA